MTDVNYAEFQQRIDAGQLTTAECERMGSTHKAYGWSRTGLGFEATEEQLAAYNKGYDAPIGGKK